MKKTTTLASFLAFTLAVASGCSSSQPVSTRQQAIMQVDSWQVRGSTAYASISSSSWDDPTCWGYSGLWFWASSQTSHTQGAPDTYEGGYLDYYDYGFCDGRYTYRWGSMALDDASFDIDRTNSATATVSMTLGGGSYECDEFWNCTWNEVEPGQLEGEVTLTGVGETFRGNSQYWYGYSAGPYRYSYRTRMSGTSRDATVTANLTLDGEPVNVGDYSYGSLSSANTGSVSQYKY